MVERVDICTHLAPKNDSNINVFQASFLKGNVFGHGGKMYAFSPVEMAINRFFNCDYLSPCLPPTLQVFSACFLFGGGFGKSYVYQGFSGFFYRQN